MVASQPFHCSNPHQTLHFPQVCLLPLTARWCAIKKIKKLKIKLLGLGPLSVGEIPISKETLALAVGLIQRARGAKDTCAPNTTTV